ncbi:MAG: RsmG family class I SAM-dependent methyltransferase [Myxococcota bacterium]
MKDASAESPRAHALFAAAAAAKAPDEALRRRLDAFEALIRRWRTKTDLVAGEGRALQEVLFLDAYVLARTTLVPERSRLLDVGAGAGAPGIPLAVLRPDLEITLLEPRRRRVAFLRTAVGSLGLAPRVRVVEGRLGDGPEPELSPFDVAMSRATFAPKEWLRRGPWLAPRVLVLAARDLPPGADGVWRYEVPSTGAPRVVGSYLSATE